MTYMIGGISQQYNKAIHIRIVDPRKATALTSIRFRRRYKVAKCHTAISPCHTSSEGPVKAL